MLDSCSVSRLHALIQRVESGGFCLIDLGSRNGSFVNGRRVSVPVRLADSDLLRFGDQELSFRTHAANSSAAAAAGTGTRNAPTTALLSHGLVTILVVDIRDFTLFARSVSESLLSQTIGTWFLKAGGIAQEKGSWAQKYIGDAVMAVWVHDDPSGVRRDLLRVLAAAGEIETATAEISRSLPLPGPLRIGAGVNTGPAIIGNADYTALGDAVNIAFRLESATKTMGLPLALGQRSFEALSTGPGFFERREVELKGYDFPSVAWGISFADLRRYLHPELGA